jgi:hypothetical protein
MPTEPSQLDHSQSNPVASAPAEAELGEVVTVPVGDLLVADSPRLAGEDVSHAHALAETAANLPPIIVHRATMRVIDGMHRLRAAQITGSTTIGVRFFDGDADAAYVLGVAANIAHGLPLSLADRKAAARRILAAFPQWSDRAVAAKAGLAHKTVGALRRRRPTGEIPQSATRVGRDGRSRPLDTGERRRRAAELLRENPEASLHEVARTTGMSRSTVQDVRNRLQAGRPVVSRDCTLPVRRAGSGAQPRVADPAAVIRQLRADPSLRFTESGRALLRWLDAGVNLGLDCDELADSVPDHCVVLITQLAQRCMVSWQRLATRLEQRACE